MAPRSWRTVAGISDQVISSASNYITAFVASLVLLPAEFGVFVVAYAIVTILSAGVRAIVGEPMLAHLPITEQSRHRSLGGSALSLAAVLGVIGLLFCLALWLAGGAFGWPILSALGAFAPWLPIAFAVDAGRYVLLARSDTVRALVVDLVWAGVQLVVLALVWAMDKWSVAVVASSWGIGAAAGLGALLVVGVERPRAPWAWLRETRYLSGWFTLTSILGQTQIYLVLLLAGTTLTTIDMAGLRAVQLLVFQPPITFMAAMLVLLTPVMARQSIGGELADLRRARRPALLAMAALGALLLLAVPLRHVLLGLLFPRYTDYATLVLPIALQTAMMGLAVPFQAQVRGFRRGRLLFLVQLMVAASLLTGAGLGLATGGVIGLAWGLTGSALVSLATVVAGTTCLRRTPAPVTATTLAGRS